MHKSRGYEKSAKFYDFFDMKENIDFFKSYAYNKEEILDIGAGTGRLAIPIAKEGIQVFCVEPSQEMLNVFRFKILNKRDLTNRINLIHSDASSFNLQRKFEYIFMSGVFDHFLDDEERINVLKNVKKHLEKDGIFVFDVFIGLMRDSPIKLAGEIEEEGKVYKRYVGSQIKNNKIIEVSLRYELYENNNLMERVEELSKVSIISKEHLFELLKGAGVEVKDVYGDYEKSIYKEGDELIILVNKLKY